MKKYLGLVVAIFFSANVWAYGFFDSEQPIDNMVDAWAKAVYELEDKHRVDLLETIWQALDSHQADWGSDQAYPVWAAVVLSDLSFEKGWLAGYQLAKEAKNLLWEVIHHDDNSQDALAYAALGRLYAYTLPWPFGFADQEKAKAYFEKSLLLEPDSLDIQFWYARYLIHQSDNEAAIVLLKHISEWPVKADHLQADQIRKKQAQAMLLQLDPDYTAETDSGADDAEESVDASDAST